MADAQLSLPELLRGLRRMARKDRKAVLARLSSEERIRLETLMERERKSGAQPASSMREAVHPGLSQLSPWLRERIEPALNGQEHEFTASTAGAIKDVAASLDASPDEGQLAASRGPVARLNAVLVRMAATS